MKPTLDIWAEEPPGQEEVSLHPGEDGDHHHCDHKLHSKCPTPPSLSPLTRNIPDLAGPGQNLIGRAGLPGLAVNTWQKQTIYNSFNRADKEIKVESVVQKVSQVLSTIALMLFIIKFCPARNTRWDLPARMITISAPARLASICSWPLNLIFLVAVLQWERFAVCFSHGLVQLQQQGLGLTNT